MRGKWVNFAPAAAAAFLLLTVEGIHLLVPVSPQRWGQFESMSNTALLLAALLALISSAVLLDSSQRAAAVLSNLTIPAVAFWLNIDVFGRRLQSAQLLADLWSLHALWVLCAAVQVLVLSGLGRALLGLARAALGQIQDLLRWGRDQVIRPIGGVVSAVPPAVQRMEGSLKAALGVGLVLWLVYLAVQISAHGAAAVLADNEVLWHSLWLWLAVVTVCFLLRMVPPVFQKGAAAIQQSSPKLVLALVALVIFVTVAGVLPSLLRTAAMVVLLPLSVTAMLWAVYRRLRGRLGAAGGAAGRGGSGGPEAEGINQRDVLVLLIAFVALPLLVICLLTALAPEGAEGADRFTTLLEFIRAAAETADTLLKLFA